MIARFVKANPVFVIAGIAALLSMLFVPPNPGYFSYIDWRTVGLLTCQLIIIQGLMESSAIKLISSGIVLKAHTTRSLSAVMIFTCFFVSMLVTNDVSLISFVPLTILMLSSAGAKDLLIPVVVLETVAANLGSMLMPFGNPQNLYLFNLSGMSGISFIKIMLPFALISFVLILFSCLFLPKRDIKQKPDGAKMFFGKGEKVEIAGSLFLFLLCILAVFHIGNVFTLLVLCIIFFLIADRKAFRKVNYVLPLTFIVFFILTGNIQAFPGFSETLSHFIDGHEMITAVLASQVISNVPAAMLLSSFTGDYHALIVGTDIGGLGTLVASMASLISFQFYCGVEGAKRGKYILEFTVVNISFLVVLLISAIFFHGTS